MAHFVMRILAVPAAAAIMGLMLPRAGTEQQAAEAPTATPRVVIKSAPQAKTTLIPVPHNGLQTDWTRLSRYPGLVHSTVSAYAYDITTHQVLSAISPSAEVTPGSVIKLFTSAAALATLGPRFTYQTTVAVPKTVVTGHPGPIYLVGGGDPWLEANGRKDLESLAGQVAARITKATQVVGVSALFSPPLYGVGWPIGGISQNYSAGSTALMAERSEVGVFVQGGSLIGQPPHVVLKFNGTAVDPSYFTIINRAVTSGSGTMASVNVTRILGTNRLLVTGHVPENSQVGPWAVSVSNPAQYAAALFQSALIKDGVSFSQSATTANTEPSAVTTLATHRSPPLFRELTTQNQYSINQMADNLYRELSAHITGTGSPNASATLMTSFTASADIDPGRVQVDGSGLSPLNQMSAKQVVELLNYSSTQPWFDTFRHSLIRINNPANCGFLCPPSWHVPLPAHTAIWVKPGNLSNQWNLAGYVQSKNGNLIAFAVLNDGTPTSQNTYPNSAVGQMVNDIADWPTAPFVRPAASPLKSGSLPVALRPIVTDIPGRGPGTNVAVAVVNAANGQIIYQQNGNTLMRSGLSPRILLDLAALQYLPGRLKPASLVETGTAQRGTLHGALILNGNNNNITPVQLQQLAQTVKSQGITAISGPTEYVSRASGFQQKNWPGGIAWESLGQSWASPASPLTVNNDQVTLSISATHAGQPPQLSLLPANAPIRLINRLTVDKSATTPSIAVTLKFNSNLFTVSGVVPPGITVTKTLTPPDAGLLAADDLQTDLAHLGITTNGTPKAIASLPAGSQTIGQVSGQTISQIVEQSLSQPSLTPANQLIAALGPHAGQKMVALLNGSPTSVSDWTGGGIGNYLTPLGTARAMARLYKNPRQSPLTRALSQGLWRSTSPEQYDALGYVTAPDHRVFAVVVMASATAWNGTMTPQILHP